MHRGTGFPARRRTHTRALFARKFQHSVLPRAPAHLSQSLEAQILSFWSPLKFLFPITFQIKRTLSVPSISKGLSPSHLVPVPEAAVPASLGRQFPAGHLGLCSGPSASLPRCCLCCAPQASSVTFPFEFPRQREVHTRASGVCHLLWEGRAPLTLWLRLACVSVPVNRAPQSGALSR